MDTFTFGEYSRQLANDASAPERAVRTIRKTVRLHAPRLIQSEINAIVPPPVDRGTYRRNFKEDDIPGGIQVYNFSPHAGIIELGRRPGEKAPPLQPIIDWVFRKGLVKHRSRGTASASQLAQARGIAFVVARAIARRGLPARYVMRNASRALDKIIRQALRDDMKATG